MWMTGMKVKRRMNVQNEDVVDITRSVKRSHSKTHFQKNLCYA